MSTQIQNQKIKSRVYRKDKATDKQLALQTIATTLIAEIADAQRSINKICGIIPASMRWEIDYRDDFDKYNYKNYATHMGETSTQTQNRILFLKKELKAAEISAQNLDRHVLSSMRWCGNDGNDVIYRTEFVKQTDTSLKPRQLERKLIRKKRTACPCKECLNA